jgi:hypothetical protein
MRYRLARAADLLPLASLIWPAPSPEEQARLVDTWNTLRARDAIRISLVEDPNLPPDAAVQAFGASVFVHRDFLTAFCAAPRPGLPREIYRRISSGDRLCFSTERFVTPIRTTGWTWSCCSSRTATPI